MYIPYFIPKFKKSWINIHIQCFFIYNLDILKEKRYITSIFEAIFSLDSVNGRNTKTH